jgi:hypothetical protein
MLVYRKEVATVSQPPFPTVPPAGLPTASTVGAKATVRASVDTRVVSGEEGAEGGEMRGATGYAHVAFFLAPRHPPWFVWLCLGRLQWWWKRRGVLRHAYAWLATAFHSRFLAVAHVCVVKTWSVRSKSFNNRKGATCVLTSWCHMVLVLD